jgi:hypothetical protein
MPPESAVPEVRKSGGILLLEAIATRPPVLIVDVAAALDGIAPEDVGDAIADLKATAQRLADGGVLVLDDQAVFAAPQDAYVLSGKQP